MKSVGESVAAGAVRFWQTRTDGQLSAADGQEIVMNICGFFQVLAEWDRSLPRLTPERDKPQRKEVRQQ